jgi:hypothetical protein
MQTFIGFDVVTSWRVVLTNITRGTQMSVFPVTGLWDKHGSMDCSEALFSCINYISDIVVRYNMHVNLTLSNVLKTYKNYIKFIYFLLYYRVIEVTQAVIKHLLTVAVQYKPTYSCDYTTAHAGHVMLQPARSCPSVVFQQSNCNDVYFISATSVHCLKRWI